LVEDCVVVPGVALPAIYWLVDNVGSKISSQLRPGALNLVDYNTFHIRRSAWSESTNVLYCMPSLEVVMDKVIWNLLEGLQEVMWVR
jgi:hypothetical protein